MDLIHLSFIFQTAEAKTAASKEAICDRVFLPALTFKMDVAVNACRSFKIQFTFQAISSRFQPPRYHAGRND